MTNKSKMAAKEKVQYELRNMYVRLTNILIRGLSKKTTVKVTQYVRKIDKHINKRAVKENYSKSYAICT